MRYTEKHHPNGGSSVILNLDALDFVSYRKLDLQDKKILDECNASPKISDKLRGLALIARKIEGEK